MKLKKNLLASAVAFALTAPTWAGDYYVIVPNQGKDDFTHLTDVVLTPLALPSGKVGEPYAGFNFNSVLSVTGDPNFTSEQVVWSVAAGQLPEGLTLNADGTLTGTPTLGTTAEGQGFTIRAAYLSKNDTELYRVTVKVAIALAGATLPEGIVGQPYPGVDLKPLVEVDGDAGFTASAVTWRLADGHALPAGLTLNANGSITGTPSAAFTGDVRVVASYQDESASQQYRFVTLALNVALANASAPQGIIGQPYAGFDLRNYLTVTGDPAFKTDAVSWAVVSGTLPAGLSFNAATGTVTGTPAEVASRTVTFRATYKNESGEQSYQFVTLSLNVALTNATAPQGIVGQAYAGFNLRNYLTVSGDPDFSGASSVTWSVASGTLPAGLTLNASTGVVSGTPTAAGSHAVTFRATYRGVSGQQTYSLVTLGIGVALATATAPAGVVGVAYAGFDLRNYLTVTGDPAFDVNAVSWSLAEGVQLPAGLTLNPNGTVSGTPTVAGTQPVTFRATYRGVSGQQSYSLVTLSIGVSLATATAPQGIVGQAYAGFNLRDYLTVSGDASFNSGSAVTWSVASGTLPAGLTLNTSTGVVSGTPTAAASSTVTFRATYRGVSGQQSYSLVTLNIGVSLATATAPQGIVGQAYAGFNLRNYLSVSGDSGFTSSSPVTWAVASGTLPAGLTLNASTGVVSGTPTAAASSTVTFRATYRGVSGQQSYSLVTLSIGVSLATATAPQGIVGQAYAGFNLRDYLTVSGDASFNSGSAVTWSVASGTLPAGLTLNTSTGVVSGTPTAAASSTVTFRATYRGVSGQQSYSLVTLNIVLTLASATLPEGKSGTAYSYDFKTLLSATGDASFTTSKATFSLSGSLPSGLSLSSAGVLAGTPSTTTAGQNFTVNASYRGVSASRAYNIKVTSASFIFNPTIASNTNNYNLRNAAVAAGWNGTTPLNATVTVNPGVYVYSTSTSTYAFDTGASFPAGSSLTLINKGFIVGRGGNGGTGNAEPGGPGGSGGPALSAKAAISINNTGTIGGGGGGGGGGYWGAGGGGGRGGSTGGIGGSYTIGKDTVQYGTAGTAGTLTAAGAAGTVNTAYTNYVGAGGAGGNLGAAGTAGKGAKNYAGSAGGAGGAAGKAVVGNSHITWIATGTRLGPID